MDTGIRVEITSVTKSFMKRTVFKAVTAQVEAGECLAITGKNGSGKSTLLKIIAGIIRPTLGATGVFLVNQRLARDEYYRHISMISPESQMYGYLTARENLKILTEAGGVHLDESSVIASLEKVGLALYANSIVHTFSTGMKQRLKLALLLALDRQLWLVDEPSANLDTDGRLVVAALIRSGLARNKTIVFATNEATEVAYATKKLTLD